MTADTPTRYRTVADHGFAETRLNERNQLHGCGIKKTVGLTAVINVLQKRGLQHYVFIRSYLDRQVRRCTGDAT